MTLFDLFLNCLTVPYIHLENGADYAILRDGTTLYIFFEKSRGREDWKNNLSFPARAYRDMRGNVWYAHRGFLKVWRTAKDCIKNDIFDPSVQKIVTVGYSHGAALAALCHEYIWFNRPDLRAFTEGYGFGSPRVFWGVGSTACKRRWKKFTVIRNIDDIVTHLPPAVFGFSHVGRLMKIGGRGRYNMIDAHRPENILKELYRLEHKELSPPRRSELFKQSATEHGVPRLPTAARFY